MALGNYGIVRGSTVQPSDVEILYYYKASRDDLREPDIKYLNSEEVLTPIKNPANNRILGGVYNLTLPADTFNKRGFYYLIVRPKEIETVIKDRGVLAGAENIVGLVFDPNLIADTNDKLKFVDGGLTGYRIEYLSDQTNEIIPNFFRIITSSNLVQEWNTTIPTPNGIPATRYRFKEDGNFLFCTISPSSPFSGKPTVLPYPGKQNQRIIITNTHFDPLMLELEMVEHDADTLAIGIFGNQVKRTGDGNLTYYDRNNRIYKQYNIWEYQNPAGRSLYQIRQNRSVIDFTMNFNDIINNNQG